MSVLDGFKEVGERTGGKLTMTVMLESVRFSKGVSEVLGRPETPLEKRTDSSMTVMVNLPPVLSPTSLKPSRTDM